MTAIEAGTTSTPGFGPDGLPDGWRPSLRARIRAQAVVRFGPAARRVAAWRLHAAVPALAGAGLLSSAAGLRFGVWAGLAVAGVFCLRLDSRL